MVIPGIVNTFIGLFKDTTLVHDHRPVRPAGRGSPRLAATNAGLAGLLGRGLMSSPAFGVLDLLLRHVALQRPWLEKQATYRSQTLEPRHNMGEAALQSEPRMAWSSARKIAIQMSDMHKWYGRVPRAEGHQPDGLPGRAYRDLRSFGLRQVDPDPLHQPAGGASAAARSSSRGHRADQRRPKNIDQIRREVGMVFQHFNLFPHLTVQGESAPWRRPGSAICRRSRSGRGCGDEATWNG